MVKTVNEHGYLSKTFDEDYEDRLKKQASNGGKYVFSQFVSSSVVRLLNSLREIQRKQQTEDREVAEIEKEQAEIFESAKNRHTRSDHKKKGKKGGGRIPKIKRIAMQNLHSTTHYHLVGGSAKNVTKKKSKSFVKKKR
jgi:hypothetical protein